MVVCRIAFGVVTGGGNIFTSFFTLYFFPACLVFCLLRGGSLHFFVVTMIGIKVDCATEDTGVTDFMGTDLVTMLRPSGYFLPAFKCEFVGHCIPTAAGGVGNELDGKFCLDFN